MLMAVTVVEQWVKELLYNLDSDFPECIQSTTNYASKVSSFQEMSILIGMVKKQFSILCSKIENCFFTIPISIETVFNLGTQESWKTKATLANVETALIQMMKIAETLQISSIALPTIGAGLGGLDWGEVKSIINKISVNNPRTELYVVENYSSKT